MCSLFLHSEREGGRGGRRGGQGRDRGREGGREGGREKRRREARDNHYRELGSTVHTQYLACISVLATEVLSNLDATLFHSSDSWLSSCCLREREGGEREGRGRGEGGEVQERGGVRGQLCS